MSIKNYALTVNYQILKLVFERYHFGWILVCLFVFMEKIGTIVSDSFLQRGLSAKE